MHEVTIRFEKTWQENDVSIVQELQKATSETKKLALWQLWFAPVRQQYRIKNTKRKSPINDYMKHMDNMETIEGNQPKPK